MSSINLGDVRLVVIRFAFSNLDLIPFCLKTSTIGRKSQLSSEIAGELAIEPIEKVGCLPIVNDLSANGYVLVDAEAELWDNSKSRKEYGVVKFIFAKAEDARMSRSFGRICETAALELETLLSQAMWRVRAFLNPHCYDDVVIPNAHAISINLEGRAQLFDANGNPEMRRHKDEYGRKIGEPYQLKPEKFLVIRDGSIVVDAEDPVIA